MGFSILVAYLGATWFAVAAAVLLITCICALLQPRIQARRATFRQQPPVSAILPIKLTHCGFETAQASIFDQAYPEYEVLFSAAESNSPALEIVERLKRDHPAIASRILQSQSDFAVSPKLNTLAAPLSAAAYDFVLVKDSNIVLDPDTTAVLMQNFVPGVGLVVGIPVAVEPQSVAGHVEAFLINTYARVLLTASVLGLGFGVGKAMIFKRSDLARVGGVDAMGYTMAEDTAISRGLAAIGLKTVFAHYGVRQLIGRRTFREIYDRQVRWSVIRRANEVTFPFEPFANALPSACAAALAAPPLGLPAAAAFAAALLGWFSCEIGVAWLKGWEVSAWSPLAFLGREIVTLAAWLRAWTTSDVVWANGRFDVFNGARGAMQSAAIPLRGDRPKIEKN